MSEIVLPELPLNLPQWKIYAQHHYDGDEQKGIVLLHAHHSFADGVSLMHLYLHLDKTFDPTKVMRVPVQSFWTRLYYKLLMPLQIPGLFTGPPV